MIENRMVLPVADDDLKAIRRCPMHRAEYIELCPKCEADNQDYMLTLTREDEESQQ